VNAAAGGFVAFAVALVATPVLARVARALGVVDEPGPLKIHDQPVPYLGGVAVFVAAALPVGAHRPGLLLPMGMALLLGLADDVHGLPPRIRLTAELAIGVVAGLVAPVPGSFGAVVTGALVIGLINAVNLLDGLDGLAGGVALASAIGFAVIGGAARTPALALAGALGGFLVFNRPPARIYLGDAGAYLAGTALALLAALAMTDPGGVGGWAAIPLLVALPVFDTVIAIVRRVRARRPVFSGDRSHVYDQLVDRGRTRVETVLVLVAAQALLAAAAAVVVQLDTLGAITFGVASAAGLVAVATIGGFISTGEGR
jgi:UDP-GlcNAc:undecaprenyl-phosphate GlcNAc-1-phosphate transferase